MIAVIIILSMLLGALLTFTALANFVTYTAGKGFIVKKRTDVLRFKRLRASNKQGIRHTMVIHIEYDELDPICDTTAFKNFFDAHKKLNRQVKLLYN